MQKPLPGHTLAVKPHLSISGSSIKMFLFQRDIAGSDIAACEPYKPKRAAAGKETQYLPGVSLPQQKQLKQGARGAAMATDEKSRSWESPKDLFSFKHLLTTGLVRTGFYYFNRQPWCPVWSALCCAGVDSWAVHERDFTAVQLQGSAG